MNTITYGDSYVNSNWYFDSGVENNEKDLKSEIGDHVWISKCRRILQKITLQIGLEMFLQLKKVIGTFYEKELQNKSTVGLIKKVSW